MPIDIGTFESAPNDKLDNNGEINADRVIQFLSTHPDRVVTQSEFRDATEVKAGSNSAVLLRLNEHGLVRHKGICWTLGDDDDVTAYTGMLETTRTVNERFGEVGIEEWLEHAVDERE